MKTFKLVDGDLVFNENGELEMVEGDEETAQGVGVCLAVREDEFELDEFLGMNRSFLSKKRASDEEIADAVLSALQIMTDQDVLEGAKEIEMERTDGMASISLEAIKGDGENLIVEGVEIDGS